ncbi:hypothetical protein OAV85_00630 [Candidatus Nanopelagicales bacterium]|nr:hypothetical protein [Candidatus Nanopelagicales bacterium]
MSSPRVYVASPLGQQTAGPEALTLLVHSFRQRGIEAYLIPMRNFRGRANHPEYADFDFDVAETIPKDDNAHLVVTEVSPIESFRELQRTPDERTWMLWLSVNFSPIPRARYYSPVHGGCSFFPPESTSRLPELWPYDDQPIRTGTFRTLREARRRTVSESSFHLPATAVETLAIGYAEHVARRNIHFGTQSFYGQGFIRSQLGRESFKVTDYPRSMPALGHIKKSPGLVVYNGAKGRWKLKELQPLLPEVEFRPLENMTYHQVCESLAEASLYVELGHLPGRDRLPREAAVAGTPTVMLARGAGFCWDDFPIGEKYRIPYTTDWAQRMAPVIREALADPSEISSTQLSFREWVEGEKQRYSESIDWWVERLVGE